VNALNIVQLLQFFSFRTQANGIGIHRRLKCWLDDFDILMNLYWKLL